MATYKVDESIWVVVIAVIRGKNKVQAIMDNTFLGTLFWLHVWLFFVFSLPHNGHNCSYNLFTILVQHPLTLFIILMFTRELGQLVMGSH